MPRLSNSKVEIPIRTSSKRPIQALGSLEDEGETIENSLRLAKKKLKAHGSFNANFWTQAAEIEGLILQKHEVARNISLRDFNGFEAEWKDCEEAKSIFEQIRSHEVQKKICIQRSEELVGRKRSIRSSFMKLFTPSNMGLAIKDTGASKRNRKDRNNFRTEIIDAYASRYEKQDWLWCPILGEWIHSKHTTAAHLFAYMHGQDTMDAIFGTTKTPELFSARNGLLVSSLVEDIFDLGKLVLVPDLPDKPSAMEIGVWIMKRPSEYKIRIIDPTWDMLDKPIQPSGPRTWRDLQDKRVEFRNSFRPRARYLYFHYCIQMLRYAWQQRPEDALVTLKSEIGKPVWATPGRYMGKRMLKALVEELGHDYQHLMQGQSCNNRADPTILLELATRQITATRKRGKEDESDDESEVSNDESDED
ncbi:hypothetical protein V8E54_007971 [Elaphomyces granulatus]